MPYGTAAGGETAAHCFDSEPGKRELQGMKNRVNRSRRAVLYILQPEQRVRHKEHWQEQKDPSRTPGSYCSRLSEEEGKSHTAVQESYLMLSFFRPCTP